MYTEEKHQLGKIVYGVGRTIQRIFDTKVERKKMSLSHKHAVENSMKKTNTEIKREISRVKWRNKRKFVLRNEKEKKKSRILSFRNCDKREREKLQVKWTKNIKR